MKRKLLFSLALGLLSFSFTPKTAMAQAMGHDYKGGIGVKVGYWAGAALDGKYFIKPNSAVEGLLSFGRNWFTITGFYEYHHPLADVPGLQWYIGPGAHLGFWSNHYRENHKSHSDDHVFLGFDGILGLDYKFNKVPIDLSLDIAPSVSFPSGGFDFLGGLSVRFAF